MANYNSSYTGAQHDTYVTKAQLVNLIYPVGSIYISVNSTSPATLFGGTWAQIQGQFLLGCNSAYTAGSTGGEATHLLTAAETPAHTHSRGTMDIGGEVRVYCDYNKGNTSFDTEGVKGAFNFTTGTDTEMGTSWNIQSGTQDAVRMIKFTASRNWTGETSSFGGGLAHNNMPPYLAVYIWKRTA